MAIQRIHQNNKNGGVCEELLSESDFEAVLATFCCYDYGANASEVVQKIITNDQKEYHKCSSYVTVCSIAKIYLSINNCEQGWLLGHLRHSLKSYRRRTEKRAIIGPW